MQRALFVTHRDHIGPALGGVQVCTDEFISVIRSAGVDLKLVKVTHANTVIEKSIRQIRTSPYFRPISGPDIRQIAECARTHQAGAIFFNQVALLGALPALRRLEMHPTKKIALSHGSEITDLLHLARLKPIYPLSGRLRPTPSLALASVLCDEARARRGIDGVVALSPFDAATEAWLGVTHTTWLPRIVVPNSLDWRSISNRFGFVGTLDHGPNLEGLVLVLEALGHSGASDIQVRIVGGPPRLGQWLATRFTCVDYVGQLDEFALRAEAATWRAFLHPIFCLSRGCSTKLATALSWGIPIITTPHGRRGYQWASGGCMEVLSPEAFVNAMRDLKEDDDAAQRFQRRSIEAAKSSPNQADVVERFRAFLKEMDEVSQKSALDPAGELTKPIQAAHSL